MADVTTTAVADVQLGACYGRYRSWAEAPAGVPAGGADTGGGAADAGDGAADAYGGVLVEFEASGVEDLRVGLAPRGASDWLYEVAIGSSGNTEVVWRKCVGRQQEADLARVFAGRTCASPDFVSYWVAVSPGGALALGIGREVVARAADPRFSAPVHRVAFTTWKAGGAFRNIVLSPLRPDVAELVAAADAALPRVLVRADPWGKEDLMGPEQREAYAREWETSRKRAERFGGAFTAPDVKKFLDSKDVRKLQRSGAATPGFATGFDLTSEQEAKKREERMKRFNTPQFAVEFSTDAARALAQGMTQDEWQEEQRKQEKLRERAQKFGLTEKEDRSKSAHAVGSLVPASAKVARERCDVKPESLLDVRDDAIHVYSLDERFQQVRTSDVMGYFLGYGPSYVEWINDSSCTVVFQDPFTAGRALIALSLPIPEQFVQAEKKEQEAAAAAAAADATEGGDVEMDDAAETMKDEGEGQGEQQMEVETEVPSVPDEPFNRSSWRFGIPIGSSSHAGDKKWRLLLRKATSDDFPPEKEPKKYHARWSGSQSSSQRRRGGSRAHPYDRSSGRRDNDRSRDDDRDNGRERSRRRRGDRSSGTPSNRFKVNEDGSINLVRNSGGGEAAVPATESSSAPPVGAAFVVDTVGAAPSTSS